MNFLKIRRINSINYPSDKLKQEQRKLYYGHRYLVYDIGYGEQGSEERYSIYRYHVCIGYSEDEVVEDWIEQSQFNKDDVQKVNNKWLVCNGRSWLKIIRLADGSDEDNEPELKW